MDDIRGARSDIPIEDYHWGRGFFRAWLIVSAIWIAFAGYLALVGLAGYVYWVEPWVLWYAHKNNVPPEKVYIDDLTIIKYERVSARRHRGSPARRRPKPK